MKKLYLSIFLLLLLFAACRKENIDEILVEEFVFTPDTLAEIGGNITLFDETEEELLSRGGYAFRCKGFHQDTTFYEVNTSFLNSSAFGLQDEGSSQRGLLKFQWIETENGVDVSSFPMMLGLPYTTLTIPWLKLYDVDSNGITLKITKLANGYISGSFEGNFYKKFDHTEVFFFKATFEVPIYENCEIAKPIGEGNSTVYLPYQPPMRIPTEYISCRTSSTQRHLISTILTTFEQYDQSPLSLLQNEGDHYIYWEGELNDGLQGIDFIDTKIKATILGETKIVKLKNTSSAPKVFPFTYASNENKIQYGLVFGNLVDIDTEEVLGKSRITLYEVMGTKTDCE
ncbi:MAG: hypothetical protein AAGG68_27810 [Bacteroidota bacterium]